jgi:hypothetical protein
MMLGPLASLCVADTGTLGNDKGSRIFEAAFCAELGGGGCGLCDGTPAPTTYERKD